MTSFQLADFPSFARWCHDSLRELERVAVLHSKFDSRVVSNYVGGCHMDQRLPSTNVPCEHFPQAHLQKQDSPKHGLLFVFTSHNIPQTQSGMLLPKTEHGEVPEWPLHLPLLGALGCIWPTTSLGGVGYLLPWHPGQRFCFFGVYLKGKATGTPPNFLVVPFGILKFVSEVFGGRRLLVFQGVPTMNHPTKSCPVGKLENRSPLWQFPGYARGINRQAPGSPKWA